MSGQGVQGTAGLAGQSVGAIGLWPKVRAGKVFLAVVGALIVLSWLGLVVWKWSPYGRFLSHEEVGGVEPFSDGYFRLLVFFIAGWTLMTVAMMLPTSLPFVAFFNALVRSRGDRAMLVALLVVGYLIVWIAFAAAVHLGDQGIHAAVERVGWLEANAWGLAAGTFLFAGVYQFSSLKYRCLEKCRSPVAFVMQNWRGQERWDALRLGVRHGTFCLGCCWSVMLVMFAVGVGNIAWMLVLAVVMATEKNMPWGRRLSAPLGIVLIGSSVVLALAGTLGVAAR